MSSNHNETTVPANPEATVQPGKLKLSRGFVVLSLFLAVALGIAMPSMLWLLFVAFAFGYSLSGEKSLNSFGFGLAFFTVLSMALNLVGIPLHWAVFALFAVLSLAYAFKTRGLDLTIPSLSPLKNWHLYAVLIFFFINLHFYYAGATKYPYLEDGDPWNHALGTLFIKERLSFSTYFDQQNYIRLYIEPYPPGYDVLMGVLAQFHDSISFVLKFYNSFLIAATLFTAYFFFARISGSKELAVFSTLVLLLVPAFMSHFIWAQTTAVMFVILSLYSLSMLASDKSYLVPSAISIAALGVTQPSTAILFVPFAALFIVSKLYQHGFAVLRPMLFAGVLGFLLATALYWIPTVLKFGTELTLRGVGVTSGLFSDTLEDTSGGIVYSVSDFFVAQPVGKIDQQVGIGIVITLLAVLGFASALVLLAERKKEFWILFSLLAVLFAIIGVQGNALPYKLFPHRFWVFLALPVALLSSYGFFHGLSVLGSAHGVFKSKLAIAIVLLAVVYGMVQTSGLQKLEVQNSIWPTHGFASSDEIDGYSSLPSLVPKNSKVFSLCNSDAVIAAMGMRTDFVKDKEYFMFKQAVANKSAAEIRAFLVPRGYEYLVLDSSCVALHGPEGANARLRELTSAEGYSLSFNNPGFFLFKLE